MKIAIPVNEKRLRSGVASSFGRAPYFLVYDTETEKSVFLDNGAAESAGGAGIKAAQAIVGSGAGALLTPRLGKNAADVLVAAEIKLYKTTAAPALKNILSCARGELSKLSETHPGFHGRGKL